jgi:mono/diheme cytochrome c family protein
MPEALVWDDMVKEHVAKPGETNVAFIFSVTNVSPAEVVIHALRPSCGCTAAKLPSQPWRLGPGAGGQIQVAMDIQGTRGLLQKHIIVDTSAGQKLLVLKINVPDAPAATDARSRNLVVALADRQAVFKNECARCHAEPAKGKQGQALFKAACAICHEAAPRASMVPDLRAVIRPANRQYWRNWMILGKVGSLMPAFAQSEGGPLTEAQVNSLVDYFMLAYSPKPRKGGPLLESPLQNPPEAVSPAPVGELPPLPPELPKPEL